MLKRLVLALLPSLLLALPQGKHVTHGKADVTCTDSRMTVNQSTDKAIIDWSSFSIGKGEKTLFVQPSKNAAILNRVVGGDISRIYGSLQANGQLFLINEKGIVVGPSGVISAHSFVGSCLSIENQDFLNEHYQFEGVAGSTFTNHGKIEASKNIILLAPSVDQQGTLSANVNTAIAAATDVYFCDTEEQLIVKVSGEGTLEQSGGIESAYAQLRAAGGEPSQLAINQTGYIHATGLQERNGEIFLVAENGRIESEGSLKDPGGKIHLLADVVNLDKELHVDVSSTTRGGEVLIGGDYQGKNPEIRNAQAVFVGEGVQIDASAKERGDGGKVIVWGDYQNVFQGNIQAEGGQLSGDGGFVEISSPMGLHYKGTVTTLAPHGKIGTLLFDPVNVNVIGGGVSAPAFPTTLPGTYAPGVNATLELGDIRPLSKLTS